MYLFQARLFKAYLNSNLIVLIWPLPFSNVKYVFFHDGIHLSSVNIFSGSLIEKFFPIVINKTITISTFDFKLKKIENIASFSCQIISKVATADN